MFPGNVAVAEVRNCGHCGQDVKPGSGHASWNGVPICNPEPGTGVMECYSLVRDHHHDIPCGLCRKVIKEKGEL